MKIEIIKRNHKIKGCINEIEENREWKEKNKTYLKELEKFFDKVENIKDEELKNNITNQMLRCDKVLTEIAEEMFRKYYQKGYQKAKLE